MRKLAIRGSTPPIMARLLFGLMFAALSGAPMGLVVNFAAAQLVAKAGGSKIQVTAASGGGTRDQAPQPHELSVCGPFNSSRFEFRGAPRHGSHQVVRLAADAAFGGRTVALKFQKYSHGAQGLPRDKEASMPLRCHQAREIQIAIAMTAALKEEGGAQLVFPSQCFAIAAGDVQFEGNRHESFTASNGTTVLLYRDVLEPFRWTNERTSDEWWSVARQGRSAGDHPLIYFQRPLIYFQRQPCKLNQQRLKNQEEQLYWVVSLT